MTPTTAITVGAQTVTIERVSARKAAVALGLIRALSRAVPDLQRNWSKFVTEYERENALELNRAQARVRYPPRLVYDAEGQPLKDDAGELVFSPSIVDSLTEEDWERAGHVLRLPKTPTTPEQIIAVLDEALGVAEDHVYRLLALFTMSNADVKAYRRDGSLDERLQGLADDLLDDAMADEVLELAVVVGETVDTQFRAKASELGDRMGNALRVFGMSPTTTGPSTSPDGPSTAKPSSSTDSAPPTTGSPTPSSTSPTTSSSPSEGSSPQTTEPERTPTPA